MLRTLLTTLIMCGLLAAGPATAREPGPQQHVPASQARDLAQIRSSQVLRVLVNQSRNSSGEVKGEPVGVEYYRLRALEHALNARVADNQEITLKIIPRAKEQLLGALQRGEGDLAAPGELLDPAGVRGVEASAPVLDQVPLLLVGRKGERSYSRVEQLSGRTVALTSASAAGAAIETINQRLALRKQAPIKVEWVDPTLAVEDVLEMVQAGIYPLTVVERPIAQRWARVMPRLRLDSKLQLAQPQALRWYVRPDAPMLRAAVDRFLATYRAPDNQDAAFERIYRRQYRVHNPLARQDRQRLESLRPVLQKHAGDQQFDWLNLAALAFKESTLDPKARGTGGAHGLMQITPSAAQRVGVSNTATVDGNVQASARYLALIRRKFFASPQLNERERMAFILAAYNLGPERVQAMRAEARRRGLNGNQWFFQTERIAMEQVGMGPVNFVNSVNKYYLAFNRERASLERLVRR
ncbi:transglycosylase SLT domain-containing protein [Pseudomonas sichuanensis]|uniref:transglycosylase SLT domain-containing protein n=1 Tax=Pseudomonas sichuanensis TaxID=2213015 RepID=UPI00244931EA|nr:transglycosylase SLT domain-containing protein [Pseudomonas sichuanensis]MDH0730095.1 transglycosylase SLT domain-containing protein [Pseudomonas sichuanensis]MDH1581321.1 transglycosylase SLT domain-containing protein [Pseudomonas sichuanensis]MDH1593729.1 transglycosylase SLT domain-containing protein [Pseudomonas sichuanensis]MDH1597237.1 transglycosylase SLT domain-containing protein [Pseudomonas sichuanensis]